MPERRSGSKIFAGTAFHRVPAPIHPWVYPAVEFGSYTTRSLVTRRQVVWLQRTRSVQFVCSCERAFKPTCRKLIVLAVFCRYLSNRSNVSAIHRQTALGGCNMQGRPKSGATNSWPLFCHILTDFHNFFHWKIS